MKQYAHTIIHLMANKKIKAQTAKSLARYIKLLNITSLSKYVQSRHLISK